MTVARLRREMSAEELNGWMRLGRIRQAEQAEQTKRVEARRGRRR